jgi:hypothetical protein
MISTNGPGAHAAAGLICFNKIITRMIDATHLNLDGALSHKKEFVA